MSESGVIPRPADRRPRRFTKTGAMGTGDAHAVFGTEGGDVVIMSDGGDIVLDRDGQDLFARQLFRAMAAAEAQAAEMEVPF